jgi:hypothetical protein
VTPKTAPVGPSTLDCQPDARAATLKGMRRADPERIYLARRAALFGNLTRTGAIDELEAEHRIAAWEREAERQGIPRLTAAFWEAGERWIAEQPWR